MKKITVTLLVLFAAQFAFADVAVPTSRWPATMHVSFHCSESGQLDTARWTIVATSAQEPSAGAYAMFHAATDSSMFISNDTLYLQLPQIRKDWPTRAFPIGHVSTEAAACEPSDDADGHNGFVSSVLPVQLNQIVTVDLQPTGVACAPGVRDSYIMNSLVVHIDVKSYTLQPKACY